MMSSSIQSTLTQNVEMTKAILADSQLIADLARGVQSSVESFRSGGTFFAIGNGASAADAQHVVGNLVGRFAYDRAPLRAQALTTNSSALTCIGNDYGYEQIFARQIWGSGKRGDVLLAISTSGNSENIVLAVRKAKELGLFVIGMTGEHGGRLNELCDVTLRIPSKTTARIQEGHILLAHILCERMEAELFPRSSETRT